MEKDVRIKFSIKRTYFQTNIDLPKGYTHHPTFKKLLMQA